MVNKKGFMRMVEAVIAIIIILAALVLIASQRGEREEANLAELLPPILEEIAASESLRTAILSYTTGGAIPTGLDTVIESRLNNPSLDFEVKICEFNSANPVQCDIGTSPTDIRGSIYSKERVITSPVQDEQNKILKIFIWRKSS